LLLRTATVTLSDAAVGWVTGRSCGACRLFDVPPHLGQDDPGLFRNAPSGSTNNPDAHAPFQLIGDNFLQPLKLPPEKYDQWQTFTITFDPKDVT